jgi:hypothetical protein
MSKIFVIQEEDYHYRIVEDEDREGSPYIKTIETDDETAVRWRLIEKAFWDMQDEMSKIRRVSK